MNLFWEFHESKVTWSMRQLLRNHYMLLNLQPWPARTCVSGRVWFHHQCHLQGCSRSGGSAAGLLFSQTSKIAETPDRLVSMAEWLIPRYEASKLICAAVLDASVFSFCAPVMCIISEVVPCEHDGQASSKCCLIIKNQILARQTCASHI